jgi:signal transduction histidine kinase
MLAAGAMGALVVLAAGRRVQRIELGATQADARARVQADVRSAFDQMARGLRDEAARAANPATIRAALGDDDTAARRLFESAAAAISGDDEGDAALTVYGPDARPIAWSGRPSELPRDRIQGAAAWFFAPGTQGLRLVYLVPVMDGASRVGAVVTERSVGLVDSGATSSVGGFRAAQSDDLHFITRIAPVSIDLPDEESARTQPVAGSFEVRTPSGEHLLTASVSPDDIAATRRRWQRATRSIALIVFAAAVLLVCGPLLDWRNAARTPRRYAAATASAAAAIVLGRVLLRVASPADWSGARVFSGAPYASTLLPPLLTSPFDFVLTALAAASLAGLLLFLVEAWRDHVACRRVAVSGPSRVVAYLIVQLVAGGVVAAVLHGHQALLRDTIAHTTIDLLHFSLHPWDTARVALQGGLVVAHATAIGLCVLALRAAAIPWLLPRRRVFVRAGAVACWIAPLTAWQVVRDGGPARQLPLLAALAVVIGLAWTANRLKARYRHGSQAFRLTLLTLGLVVPAMAFYPTMFRLAWQAKTQLVESNFAPEAINQRQTVQNQLHDTLEQIDRFPGLEDLVTARATPDDAEAPTDRAFAVWQTTALAAYPTTSSVELYGRDGRLVSRFAFNLPEDLTGTPRSDVRTCDWDVYQEVSRFFAEDRRVLRAGRALCVPGKASPVGSIVVHVILDYENLPFISSRSPYVELLRPTDPLRTEALPGRDVEYVVYGWSRTPLYSSRDTAWQIPDAVFARLQQSRQPFWAELRRESQPYDVYLQNDRGGIYALGFPVVSFLEHLVNLAELTVLATLTYVVLLLLNALFGWMSRRRTTARALLREIRASFYRKLFLAFVLAVLLPVTALAVVTRNYVAEQMRGNVEQEAVRTAAAAGRVVEDLVAPRAGQQGLAVDDNLMVWVSWLIDQDVNVFTDARLTATSERNLFASGLLPTRTPADVYYPLELENQTAAVTREHIGSFEYLMAAAPLKVRQLDAMLTVPLTSRQQEIEGEIDTLDRRVLLGALIFILLGAGLGYRMAERIADPVDRLTRATRRIARGDFDARIAATSSDELRRLVEDCNSMAADLQRQRHELQRTHRLEAWAEMARQVAHELKNPLTPIQLNAEHLRRVHADRGEPLGPVVQDCVNTILTQVRLLRQIASEFSSFASSPSAKRAPVDVGELLREIIDPYRAGLEERIQFEVDVPAALPFVLIDRTLVARSLTNIVENALHSMPGPGTLRVAAEPSDSVVRVRVSDTGAGMDAEALARAFEPYFSTKATGTGLGLPIARRNVELSGGTIAVASERDKGTTVEVTLPVAGQV